MEQIKLKAPAKLNLALDVVGLLPNGYHELDMIMQTVEIYENITLSKSDVITLKCDAPYVPCNEKNTAFKAAKLFFEYAGVNSGVEIFVEKNIPVRAGMAGGSADAAAVLVGLNELYETNYSKETLCEIGVKIGADVPFSIIGGTARVKGIGEMIKPIIAPNLDQYHVIVVMPGEGVSTPEAFRKYDEIGSSDHPDCDAVETSLTFGNMGEVCASMKNALQEASGAKHTKDICDIMKYYKPLGAMMTGSGAAVFGVYDDIEKANKAMRELSMSYDYVRLTKFCSDGVTVVE